MPEVMTEGEWGAALLQSKGCLACHSTDGTARTGPTFKGLWGSDRRVITNGEARTVYADEAYIARSLRDPDADIAAGYKAGAMPRVELSDADVHGIARALQMPEALEAARSARGGSIVPLASAAIAFVLLHFILSSMPVR